MKHKYSKKVAGILVPGISVARISAALGLGAAAALSLAAMPAASAATATASATPTWHVVGTIPGDPSGQVAAVVPTGPTSGYAFTNGTASVPAAYQRTGATTWKRIAFPGNSSEQVVAAASGLVDTTTNVWAFENNYHNGESVALKLVNGKWVAMRTFNGYIGGVSVLSPTDVWVYGTSVTSPKGPLGVYDFTGTAWHKVAATLQGGGEVGSMTYGDTAARSWRTTTTGAGRAPTWRRCWRKRPATAR